MFLLDTNVISELRKASTSKAEKNVVEWATQQSVGSMFISAISILEIEMGILQKERKDPAQAAILRTWLNSHVLKAFSDRILPIDTSVAIQCAKLHVPNPKSERDAMIGATAKVHGMTLITRNVKDFKHMNLDIYNPWLTS
ncbi:type II toxin-antitoxin system VapC family toxin [Thalassomonas sp. M1454]|uniref:type II toxin-antitoxin system VapC family toxin n=1 Tax=Thalassomonas sp. M1454 TaxID=2594477 RepID=UPI0011808E34|nr:type II toxin-antitoxin system VapC family toxin [Thalassomonas sp. M1454]TRX54476.1 type II toxin-antitoxin system VapC family toxin [Thalassomonas sp. M1454]